MEFFGTLILSFLLMVILGPIYIKYLKKLEYGQQIREEGPSTHYGKEGIPTMGGILIIITALFPNVIFVRFTAEAVMVLAVFILMGLIGFFDDFLQIRRQTSLGLKAYQKILGQAAVGLIPAVFIYYFTDIGTGVIVPGTGKILDFQIYIIPLIIITVIGTANAVNLTDGLDGLAAGVTVMVTAALAVMLALMGWPELVLISLSIIGACLGFLWFNSYPAQIFMGDVGSLALGGLIATLAVVARLELFLLIIGGIYVLEALSVMIQVSYYKMSGGKRIFQMSPLHHHYELKGWEESKIVVRFVLISFIFSAVGLAFFYWGY